MPDNPTNYIATSTELAATADAIREKTGYSTPIEWEEDTGFANAIADIPSGGGSVITVIDSTDSHGGTIKTIEAVDISRDTVTSSVLQFGYTAHNRLGEPITGTYVPPGSNPQTKTVTPSETAQVITADSGYVLQEVDIDAVPSDYVGSGITRRSSTDLTASGATVTAPAGYYASESSKAVASGTQGTPSISVSSAGLITASCTDTTGYISGTTKTATQQMTARTSSDLTASGATVTAPAGYYNAAASKSVASGTAGTPTATKGSVSNHSVTVTPSVTNTTGYITGSTKTGTGVTVSASELVSGSETKTENGTYDVTNLAELVVNVSGGGTSKNAQVVQGTTRTNSSTLTAIGAELTVSKAGTYDIYYSCLRTNTSSSYTWATRLYIDGVAYGSSENTTWTNNQQNTHLTGISLTANQKLRVYGRETRGSSYYVCAPMLAIIEN